jgi:hypothetical protein
MSSQRNQLYPHPSNPPPNNMVMQTADDTPYMYTEQLTDFLGAHESS